MASTFRCKCGQRLALRPEMAGRRVKCPACKEALTVPQGPPPPYQALFGPLPWCRAGVVLTPDEVIWVRAPFLRSVAILGLVMLLPFTAMVIWVMVDVWSRQPIWAKLMTGTLPLFLGAACVRALRSSADKRQAWQLMTSLSRDSSRGDELVRTLKSLGAACSAYPHSEIRKCKYHGTHNAIVVLTVANDLVVIRTWDEKRARAFVDDCCKLRGRGTP